MLRAELKRRLVHLSGVVLPLAYVLGILTWRQLQLVMILGVVGTLGLEAARLLGDLEWAIFDELTRSYEEEYLAGYALYVISSTAVILAFEPTIAVPAVMMLMVGDPISGILGSGELRAVKQAHALAAMFAVSLALALAFVHVVPAVLGALAATIADGVKPVIKGYVIDDNLTIPVVAAAAMVLGEQLLPVIL